MVETLLAGRSALAVFPTGGGKSLCYQLPALVFDGVTVVVSPLIALMKDQIDALVLLGIDAARLDSSLGPDEVRDVSERLRAGSLKLLYVAPERFNNERFLAQLEETPISLFAVDEAHCISEWGHNFRPDYLKLAARARELGAERVLALTATATPAVVRDICSGFEIAETDAVVTGFYRPNLTLLTTPVRAAERDGLLIDRLRERAPGPTIVYVTLQRTALRVASLLAAAGLAARPYHAGMSPEDRVATQEWWTAAGDGIVVATIAFGMGIDKADVRYVYHLNLPKGLESYSQEIGRAGRDGAPAICELFACRDDVPTLENFAYGDTPTRESLAGLLEEVFANGDGVEFAVSEYELSARLDIRPLVLRTILTYLELEGLLRQGTPFYAGYSFRPVTGSFEDVFAGFDAGRADFLRRLVASGKTGRSWTNLDPDAAAARARRGARPDRGGARVPRAAAAHRAASGRRAPALHRARTARLGGRAARTSRRTVSAPGGGRDRPHRARRLARHPRRLPGQRPRGLVRRGTQRAVRPLHVLPHRCSADAPGAGSTAAARRRRRPPRAGGADRRAPRGAGSGTAARPLSVRDHEPGGEPCEARAGRRVRRRSVAPVR